MKIKTRYCSFKRDKKNLIIFPEKPFWLVGDDSLELFVDFFSGKIDEDVLLNEAISNYNYSPEEYQETLANLESIFSAAKLDEDSKDDTSKKIDYNTYFPLPVINVTRRCNLSCKHCYADAGEKWKNEEMTTDQIKKVIHDIVYNYAKTTIDKRILLSGGEPFLRKDIYEIISYIKNIGATPLVNTNAILIEENYMDMLRETGAELLVSLDGSTKETHEFIRGKGTFDKTIEKIKLLKQYDVITKLSMTMHSKSIKDLPGFFELSEKLNVDGIAINILNVLERADKCGIKRALLKDVNRIIYECSKKSDKSFKYASVTDFANLGAILLMNWKFVYCGVGAASLVIDYNGDVYPCYNNMHKDMLLGNVLKDDMINIWNNSKKLKYLRSLNVNNFSEKCKNCAVKYYCGGGCRGETYYAYKTYDSPCPNCQDNYDGIIDLMFLLGEGDNELFENRVHYYENMDIFKRFNKTF